LLAVGYLGVGMDSDSDGDLDDGYGDQRFSFSGKSPVTRGIGSGFGSGGSGGGSGGRRINE